MFNFLKNLFGKKEEYSYPDDFIVITYNDVSIRNGIEDFQNKRVIRYKYNKKTGKIEEFKNYKYSDSLIYNLRRIMKIPVHDKTEKEIKYPVYGDILLDEVSYKKG